MEEEGSGRQEEEKVNEEWKRNEGTVHGRQVKEKKLEKKYMTAGRVKECRRKERKRKRRKYRENKGIREKK